MKFSLIAWSCLLLSNELSIVDAVTSLKGQKKGQRMLQGKLPKGEKRFCREKIGGKDELSISCRDKKRKGDSIAFKVDPESAGMDVGIEYKAYDTLDDESTVKTETKFDVSYTQMLEYIPNPDNVESGYSFNNDETPVVQTIDLATWAEYDDSGSNIEDGIYSYIMKTEDENTSFRFTVDTNANPETGFSASTMKIDVDIVNFPWKQTDTFLALISEVRSEKKVKTNYKKVQKGGKKGLIQGNVDEIAQGYSEGQGLGSSTLFEVDLGGIGTIDNYNPFGVYKIKEDALVTVADEKRRTLQDKESMDVSNSGEMSKEDMAVNKDDTGMSKEDFAQNNAEGLITKTIFVVATEDVNENVETDTNSKSTIAFSFINSNNATEIYWDPEVGVGYNSAASNKQYWFFGLTTIVIAVGNFLL